MANQARAGEALTVQDLSVAFGSGPGAVEVVDRVSFSLRSGKILALVGESGSGKSVTASAIMGLLPQPQGRVTGGAIHFEGRDILHLSDADRRRLRGGEIAMIFQEPMTALNPVQRVGQQISEVLALHQPGMGGPGRSAAVLEKLRQVEMPSPESRVRAYPFQLSGGMRQRVMIAMALAGNPKLLLADEPTTALDVTVQAQILTLIRNLQEERRMGVLYITHDMGVVAELCDDVVVMYAGQVVETGSVEEIFREPLHPYTRGLIASMPRLDSKPKSRLTAIPGTVPAPLDYPRTSCRFAPRCPLADATCRSRQPEPETASGSDRRVRCFKAGVKS